MVQRLPGECPQRWYTFGALIHEEVSKKEKGELFSLLSVNLNRIQIATVFGFSIAHLLPNWQCNRD
jgi:hypothetical protein